MIERRTRDLAMFNLAIDCKLRGCDLVALKVEDIAPGSYTIHRVTAVDDGLRAEGKRAKTTREGVYLQGTVA
jgi:integrase